MSCLDDETVLALVQGALDRASARAAGAHVARCTDCETVVAHAARYFLPPDAGTMIGRYRIVDVLGHGGAAVVYRAHDPELDRVVALKVPRGQIGTADERERLLSEARALARLSHPNVVRVHDAGTHEGQVFIALELVEGETLTAWLRREPRGLDEIQSLFTMAGRGLAAAHAAGVVHGDFKPDNVLIGTDGRVLVTDFGLARARPVFPAVATGEADARGIPPAGTPAFMAPEQLRGKDADFKSDQFSFCVALHVALYGVFPFGLPGAGSQDVATYLRRVVEDHRVRPQPRRGARWRAPVFERGLAARAEERFPSMEDLVLAISRPPPIVRVTAALRRPAVLVPLILMAMAFAGLVTFLTSQRRARDRQDGRVPLVARCGNGVVDPEEDCDDGDADDQDGCTRRCISCPPRPLGSVWAGTDHCYVRFDRPQTWEAAHSTCWAIGGNIATFVGYDRPGSLFSGVGKWMELPSRSMPRCTIQVQPSALGAGQGWQTLDCNQTAPFMCEKSGWVVHEATHHAYRLFPRPGTWAQASAACERIGTHLATLETPDEASFVTLATVGSYWIGARGDGEGGTFRWTDGQPLRHPGFPPGRRDDAGLCVLVDYERAWVPRPCDREFSFLCEAEAEPKKNRK